MLEAGNEIETHEHASEFQINAVLI